MVADGNPGRLVLLGTTHRVPAGLLGWPAWEALRTADAVTVADDRHPLVAALTAAGVAVQPVAPTSATALATVLLDRAAAGDAVVHVLAPDGDAELAAALAAVLAGRAERGAVPVVEALAGSWDPPGARLLDLVAVMDRLRSPGGCPWDAAQTHRSLVPYLLEEAYETIEVIETGDLVGLREELGDLLLQVVFHARIGEEHADAPWSVDDVAAGIVDKLVGRHPHVFAADDGATATTAADVDASWHALKAAEKGRTSAVDGVPLAQPALALAAKLLSRAARAGIDVPVTEPPFRTAAEPATPDAEVGAALLRIVADAVRRGVDAEGALRAAARRYAERVRAAETAPPA